jgi:hypothetical protein
VFVSKAIAKALETNMTLTTLLPRYRAVNVMFVSKASGIALAPSSPIGLSPRYRAINVVLVSNALATALALSIPI